EAALGLVLIEKRAVAVIDERFDGDAELPAVVERDPVVMRDPHRAWVVVQPLVELARLRRPGFLAHRAAPYGEHAAARPRARFEDPTRVAELAALVGGGESGHARAQNH